MARDDLAARQRTVFPQAVSLPVLLGAAGWTLSAAFFVVQGVAQAAYRPAYDMATNLISDLGNTACAAAHCSPLHGLVNATFIVTGALQWLGAILTSRAWPGTRRCIAARSLLALGGALLIVVGRAPENESTIVHSGAALVGLVSLNLAMLGLGACLARSRRRLGGSAIAAGVLGLVGLALFIAGAGPRGFTERLADYPATVMVVAFGVAVLAAWVSRARGSGLARG